MTQALPPITPDQIAVICPTKDRPQSVARLLDCLRQSTIKPAQILIADGGHNLKKLTNSYKKYLNITCLYCPQAGQILQRNYAHQHLKEEIRLVIHLDDSFSFEEDALGLMLKAWNKAQNAGRKKPLGGAAFNVVDFAIKTDSIFRRLFFFANEPRGVVNISGYNTRFCTAEKTHNTEWLAGGSTVWAREIIDTIPHPMSFATRWATCEDVMFSYPLRHRYRMIVVAEATIRYNETVGEMNSVNKKSEKKTSFRQNFFYGISFVVMRYYFVRQNDNLSILAFIWMTLGILSGHLLLGLTKSPSRLGVFIGGMDGLGRVIVNFLTRQDSDKPARNLIHIKR